MGQGVVFETIYGGKLRREVVFVGDLVELLEVWAAAAKRSDDLPDAAVGVKIKYKYTFVVCGLDVAPVPLIARVHCELHSAG